MTSVMAFAFPNEFVWLEAKCPVRNLARRYSIEMQMDLFGQIVVECSWGRIGATGQRRRLSFTDSAAARRFVERTLQRRKAAKGRIGVEYEVVESR